jgi:hypothetical protein
MMRCRSLSRSGRRVRAEWDALISSFVHFVFFFFFNFAIFFSVASRVFYLYTCFVLLHLFLMFFSRARHYPHHDAGHDTGRF